MKKSTKIEFNHNRLPRIETIDQFAELLFPGNRNHQKLCLAIFIELKYADSQFLKSLEWIAENYGFSNRVLAEVRAKMRRLGLIDHVSRFNAKQGYREGWVFSKRFWKSSMILADLPDKFREIKDSKQEARDRDLFKYL
jgi:hypothetical protein